MSKTIKSIDKYRFNTFTDGNYDETIEITGEILSHTEYDSQGNITVAVTYDTHGNIAEHICNTYNEENKMTEEKMYDQDEVVEKRQFEYNEKGFTVKEKIFYLDDSYDTLYSFYDDENRLIEKKLVNTELETEALYTFQYEDQKIVKESNYDAGNNLIFEKTYSYDQYGNLEKLSENDVLEDELTETFYEYDDKGNRKRILKYDKGGQLAERSTYKYDENNQLIALVEDTTHLSTVYQFEYYENGKLKTQKEIGEDEAVIATQTYNYEEDILTETISEGEGYSHNYIIRNEIEYYN